MTDAIVTERQGEDRVTIKVMDNNRPCCFFPYDTNSTTAVTTRLKYSLTILVKTKLEVLLVKTVET